MRKNFLLESKKFDLENYRHFAPVMTLGNGYLGCRGFMEENQTGIHDLGGIYPSGLFGWASYIPWSGTGHELVNAPNCFKTTIFINNEFMHIDESTISNYSSELDMYRGMFTRSYIYTHKDIQVKFTFLRFVSMHTKEILGQSVSVQNLGGKVNLTIAFDIKDDVTNLNEVSSEPWPLQPGKKQFDTLHKNKQYVHVQLKNKKKDELVCAHKFYTNHILSNDNDNTYSFSLDTHESTTIKRLISITSTRYHEKPLAYALQQLEEQVSFDDALEQHQKTLAAIWDKSDVRIEGCDADQISLRYNIFQLIQACPEHDEYLSIGARGLTGEMYEGCVFWDTEIFMLPFFTFTNPEAAKKLLMYRYHTLPQARKHAASNYFDGAMYGWQVNEHGEEQTPQGVGAYYSIHVIADIAYAISQYWYATKDVKFMLDHGIEILIETARFWKSRVQKDETTQQYHILGVRGPNEYDVIVNNNTYTNCMAIQNLILCRDFINQFETLYPEWLSNLKSNLKFNESEVKGWNDLISNIYIPYIKESKLYLEDDRYHMRRAVNIAELKKTKKRIIDTTIPYEALTMYQISKQADVLHVMINLPWMFTPEEIHCAWDYYVPKTCFDSSLSYSMHALMGARISENEHSIEFFRKSANLDINNQQLNTISGLHFANFGGTWQSVVFGFAGLILHPDKIEIRPALPQEWVSISFNFKYHDQSYHFEASHTHLSILGEMSTNIFEINGVSYTMCETGIQLEMEI